MFGLNMVFGWVAVVLVALFAVLGTWHVSGWACDADNVKCRRIWFVTLAGLVGSLVAAATWMRRDALFASGDSILGDATLGDATMDVSAEI